MHQTACYEQPLNERIRTFLRLEFLFEQFAHSQTGKSHWDARSALHRLLEILTFIGRNELRAELLKELERQATALGKLRETPGVSADTLASILEEINHRTNVLFDLDTVAMESVRKSDLLNSVRQRSAIPGGTCNFDLPGLHNWLQRSPAECFEHLDRWIQPLRPLQDALGLLLRLIRGSARPSQEIANDGFFQKSLDASSPNQMVRVVVPAELGVYPEISGGRHRFSIRFMEHPDPNKRPTKSFDDIPFQLVCCSM